MSSNHKFVEFYTKHLKSNTAKEILNKELQLYLDVSYHLYQIRVRENEAKCVKSFEQKAYSGTKMVQLLSRMVNFNWYPHGREADFKPTASDAVEMLEKLIAKLKTSQGDQKFAFATETGWGIYTKKIAVFKEFGFLKEGLEHVGPDMKSRLTYDQLLPFNNKNHNEANCVTAKDLPSFYKNKE